MDTFGVLNISMCTMEGGILQRLSEELEEDLGPTVIKPRNRKDSPDVSKRDNSRTHDVPVSVDLEANQKGQAEKMTMLTELIDNSNTLKSDVENSGTRAHSRRAATKIS